MNNVVNDVTPTEAYAALRANPDAVLVDVRTDAEWTYVGLPDLRDVGADLVCVEWQSFPSGRVNADFVAQLRTEGVTDVPLYFLCRSGARSQAAAELASAHGYSTVFNVTDGFEGPLDASGKRTVSGWKNSGLPWRQS